MKFTPHEMSVLVFIAQRPDFLSHYISSLGVEARQVAEFLAGSPPASSAVEAAGLGIRADAARRRLVAEVDSPAELAAAKKRPDLAAALREAATRVHWLVEATLAEVALAEEE